MHGSEGGRERERKEIFISLVRDNGSNPYPLTWTASAPLCLSISKCLWQQESGVKWSSISQADWELRCNQLMLRRRQSACALSLDQLNSTQLNSTAVSDRHNFGVGANEWYRIMRLWERRSHFVRQCFNKFISPSKQAIKRRHWAFFDFLNPAAVDDPIL